MTMIATLRQLDLSDWVSPLLIKELRQGLKDAFFLIALLGVLFVLGFLVGDEIFFADSTWNETVSRILMVLGWFLLTGLLPVRAFFSASIVTEIENNTFDSLILTSIGVRGIILGKWCSYVFQSFLLSALLLPFLEAQYLVGSNNFLSSIGELALMFCANCGLTAVVIGLSCIRLPFIRYGALIMTGITTWNVVMDTIQAYSYRYYPGYLASTPWTTGQFMVLTAAALLFAFVFPFIVAEMLVAYFSVTDSSPLFRRLFLFITFQVGTWIFVFLERDHQVFYFGFISTIFPFFLVELVQPASWKPVQNWQNDFWLAQHPLGSLVYSLLLVPVFMITLSAQSFLFPFKSSEYPNTFVLGLTFWGMIVFPLIIRDMILRHYQRNIVFLVFCTFLLFGVDYLVSSYCSKDFEPWVGFLPAFGPILRPGDPTSAVCGIIMNLLSTYILVSWHWRLLNREALALKGGVSFTERSTRLPENTVMTRRTAVS